MYQKTLNGTGGQSGLDKPKMGAPQDLYWLEQLLYPSRRRRWWVEGMFISSRYLATVRRVN
jgi:hypothetical protein